MDAALRAGAAVFNAGHYHAAHDAWEERWLDLDSDTDDERFLHGLIQYTAAVHHARDGNWEGATGLATSAGEYLAGLPTDYRELNVGDLRAYLDRLAADPEVIERRQPPAIQVGEDVPSLAGLDLDASLAAAGPLAEALDVDAETEAAVERGVAYARADLADGDERSRFATLAWDFVTDAEHRGLVASRLGQHVDRRRRRERDVDGLFE